MQLCDMVDGMVQLEPAGTTHPPSMSCMHGLATGPKDASRLLLSYVSAKLLSLAAVCCPCAVQADMYMLKQRPDFKQKFLPPEEGAEGEGAAGGDDDEEKPWRRSKQQAQLDAEIAERTAQLAAAARSPAAGQASQAAVQATSPAEAAEPAPQAAAPASAPQQPADSTAPVQKSWWSVKWKW